MAKKFVPAFEWPGPLNPDARRVEIDEFIVDNAMTNLFLIALREMQDVKLLGADNEKEDWFSFYNLGSIHGHPLEHWRHVPNKSADDPKNGYYCTHGSTVFPTWHRCEIVMFEQAIYRKMEAVANRFTKPEEKSYFLDALKRYRLPYWDPIMPRNKINESEPTERLQVQSMFGVPKIFKAKEVHVKHPEKGEGPIPNPLYSFVFPTAKDYEESKRLRIEYEKFPDLSPYISTSTIRTPDKDGKTDDAWFEKEVQGQASSLATTMWQMLSPGPGANETEGEFFDNDEKAWDVFANHFKDRAVGERDDNWADGGVSLESWHDNVHVLVGKGDGVTGHMGVTEIAAFDPIFFFHHNNVERLLALYQAIYGHGENKFVPKSAVHPNRLHDTSELAPFEKDKSGKCYSSEDVKDWTQMKYGMPGTKELSNAGKLQLALYLHETYFWATVLSRPPNSLTYPRDLSTVYALNGGTFKFEPPKPVTFVAFDGTDVVAKSFPQDSANPSKKAVDLTMRNESRNYGLFPEGSFVSRDGKGTMKTWNALVEIPKYAFQGSFLVQIFLGKDEVPPDSKASGFDKAPNQVGFTAIFASGDALDCDNCAKNAAMIYNDVVPLTTELPKYLESNVLNPNQWPPQRLRILKNLDPESVVPFLKQHLEWRIVTPAGEVKSREDVIASNLKIRVAARDFDFPTERNPLGAYSRYTDYPEITQGKAGGLPPLAS